MWKKIILVFLVLVSTSLSAAQFSENTGGSTEIDVKVSRPIDNWLQLQVSNFFDGLFGESRADSGRRQGSSFAVSKDSIQVG